MTTPAIKFNKHNVSFNGKKARVRYSAFTTVTTGRKCVTLYAKDYTNDLYDVMGAAGFEVENNTDIQTDYFEKSRVRIYEGHALYAAALIRAEGN